MIYTTVAIKNLNKILNDKVVAWSATNTCQACRCYFDEHARIVVVLTGRSREVSILCDDCMSKLTEMQIQSDKKKSILCEHGFGLNCDRCFIESP